MILHTLNLTKETNNCMINVFCCHNYLESTRQIRKTDGAYYSKKKYEGYTKYTLSKLDYPFIQPLGQYGNMVIWTLLYVKHILMFCNMHYSRYSFNLCLFSCNCRHCNLLDRDIHFAD